MLMDIKTFLSKYENLMFWFISYNPHYFRIKAVTTEFDEIHVICKVTVNHNDEIRLNMEYPLKNFSVLCAMIKKNSGEICLIDNIWDARSYFI